MTKTVKIVDILTSDGVAGRVLGDFQTVTKIIADCKDEYLYLEVLNDRRKMSRVMLLNQPRKVILIGEEHDAEMDDDTGVEGVPPESNNGELNVGLG